MLCSLIFKLHPIIFKWHSKLAEYVSCADSFKYITCKYLSAGIILQIFVKALQETQSHFQCIFEGTEVQIHTYM